MTDPIEGFDSAARMIPRDATPEQILWLRKIRAVAKRSIMLDLAHACDAKAAAIRTANPGRGKWTVSQAGMAMAAVAMDLGDMISAEREKIGVPEVPRPELFNPGMADVQRVIEAAREALLQIQYLAEKFTPTGSGASVEARLSSALAVFDAHRKETKP